MKRLIALMMCAVSPGFTGQCDFESVGELTQHQFASQAQNWIYHDTAGLIRAYCVNNADDFSVVASNSWSTTLDEEDWDRCGFSFSSLRGDTILLVANTQPGYNNYFNAYRSVKLDVMTGDVLNESSLQSWTSNDAFMHDGLTDHVLYTSSNFVLRCWSPWTDELLWTIPLSEYSQFTGVNRFGTYRSGQSFEFFSAWNNGEPMRIHSRGKDLGELFYVDVSTGIADLFLAKTQDGGDAIISLNTNNGLYQVFNAQLEEIESGQINIFQNESADFSFIQPSDSVISVVHASPRNVSSPEGVTLYNDQDYACGVPDYIKIDYRLPGFELLQVCEFTPNISIVAQSVYGLRLAGEDIIGFNAGPLDDDGTVLASIASSTPLLDGCIDIDSDGICDNIDSVVPNLFCGAGTIWDAGAQQCIVANPSDSNFDGCVQLNDLLDLLSAYGNCSAEESPWQCGDPLEYQGYDYETVQIGEQCWFAENLRNENYENGDDIPTGLNDEEWSNTTSGAVAVYGEDDYFNCNNISPDIDSCDPAQSLEEYGRLYNWYAVDDARGLCPSSWHVPTDGEWTVMTDELGGESIAGGQMKTTYGWYNSGNGTNSSGFSGLPGGLRYTSGYFNIAGDYGYWWSSSPNGSFAWLRYLHADYGTVYRNSGFQRYGSSVRCVRDAE